MVTKKGTVISKEGKYFLEVDGQSTIISEKSISNPTALKSMAGKAVNVEYSDGKSTFPVSIEVPVAAMKGRPRIRITCYLPKLDFSAHAFTEAMRADLATHMVKEGLITKPLAEKISIQKI